MIRAAYRLLLRLHPEPFRARFATEMLWIYDQNPHAALFGDAILSLVRQHAKSHPQPVVAGFGPMETGSGITPRRLAEATTLAALFLAAILALLGHPPRITYLSCPPAARPVRKPIQAPTRIAPLKIATRPNPNRPTGPETVDNAVAGALKFLRTQSTNTVVCAPTS